MLIFILISRIFFNPVDLSLFQDNNLAQEEVNITIYRKSSFQSISFTIIVNGERIEESFRPNSVISFQVPAGNVLIETKGNILVEKKKFSIITKPGQTYFLEAVLESDFILNSLYLVSRDKSTATKTIESIQKKTQKK